MRAEIDAQLLATIQSMQKYMLPIHSLLCEGRRDTAFLFAMEVEKAAQQLCQRLNDLKYHDMPDSGTVMPKVGI